MLAVRQLEQFATCRTLKAGLVEIAIEPGQPLITRQTQQLPARGANRPAFVRRSSSDKLLLNATALPDCGAQGIRPSKRIEFTQGITTRCS